MQVLKSGHYGYIDPFCFDGVVVLIGEPPVPGEYPGNQGGWVQIVPWLVLAVFYFLSAGSDPTPETTWTTFYREMLCTGEVHRHDEKYSKQMAHHEL